MDEIWTRNGLFDWEMGQNWTKIEPKTEQNWIKVNIRIKIESKLDQKQTKNEPNHTRNLPKIEQRSTEKN